MADWFSDMVAQVSDEVLASSGTESRLALTDRVTAGDLKTAAIQSEDDLRTQFADSVRQVQQIRDNIQLAERDALAPEWQAVRAAQDLLMQAHAGAPITPRLFLRLLAAEQPDRPVGSADEARQALDAAREAYEAARVNGKIDQLEPIRTLEADGNRRLSALHDLLYQAVLLKVNGAIDDVLEASYDRGFTYAEPAVLTDPLEVSVQPVNTDAYEEIKYFIDKVGSGTIGVAGPRGSGKSTLLSRFAATVTTQDGPRQWGVCVPAPARYDPRDFLLYLFGQLCVQVLGPDHARRVESRLTDAKPPARKPLPVRLLTFAGATVLACFAVVIGLRTARPGGSPVRMADLEIACCAAVVLLAILAYGYTHPPIRDRPFASYDVPPPSAGAFSRLIRFVLWLILLLSAATAASLLGLLLAGGSLDPGYLAAGGLAIASVTAPVAHWRWVRPKSYADRTPFLGPGYSQVRAAEEWYAKVKFQQSYTTGWSGTITVGGSSLPAQAQGGSSGSTAVTPVAMSTPEIVGAIKSFTQVMSSARQEDDGSGPKVPVVIGIDEVDKIEDPREAQAFLNQIKGLFGDSSSLFLVSISDDAMAAFERRGMPFRDAFDSSLSAVVTLSYLSRTEARTLTGSRLVGVQEPVSDLLFVLAGGLARDLVRLIRRAVEAREAGKAKLDDLALALIASEVETKKRAVLARARTLERCPATDDLLAWAGKRDPQASSADQYLGGLLARATALIGSACDGASHQVPDSKETADSGGCAAREIGVFGFWLATAGQVLLGCSGREDFVEGQTAGTEKSFERLAQARQNFPLGPDYVLATTKEVRKAWALPDATAAWPQVAMSG
jgi:hypothetical protein